MSEEYKSVELIAIDKDEYDYLQSLVVSGRPIDIDLCQAREAKIEEMSAMSEQIIHAGTDITLSDDGKFAGVATLNAENGAIYTVVHFFGFEYSSALNTQKVPDVTALGLKFTSGSTLTLFGDKGIYQIKKNVTNMIMN